MNYKLMNEITKILIFSRYEDINGRGNTAQEIQDFEKRAIDTYLGKSDDPHKIVFNTFHAKIERDVALILRTIVHHSNQAKNLYAIGQCSRNYHKEQRLNGYNFCPRCGKQLRTLI